MIAASAKDAIRRSLVGIATKIRRTEFSEVAHEAGNPGQRRPRLLIMHAR
ncbi:unnamed protein product [Mycena citricolor]|uniref:Uncharacterized protein n=1 Tax=Mycena citricolor TaxID=2018698 RepID=A0AAD2HR92_9AGAR|nr:unnamed protein product [Mycena citricolor]